MGVQKLPTTYLGIGFLPFGVQWSRGCYSKSNISYINYGGRGITVCEEWIDSPAKFIEDMESTYQDGLSLDRIDNDKGYSKENCKWSTRTEQNINKEWEKIIPQGL